MSTPLNQTPAISFFVALQTTFQLVDSLRLQVAMHQSVAMTLEKTHKALVIATSTKLNRN